MFSKYIHSIKRFSTEFYPAGIEICARSETKIEALTCNGTEGVAFCQRPGSHVLVLLLATVHVEIRDDNFLFQPGFFLIYTIYVLTSCSRFSLFSSSVFDLLLISFLRLSRITTALLRFNRAFCKSLGIKTDNII